MNLCVIPAKGISLRIPGKNVRQFEGKPMLAHAIAIAQESGLFGNAIYVSTDSPVTAELARQYGAQPIERPPALAERDGAADVGTQEVTRHAIERIQHGLTLMVADAITIDADNVCCLYPTALFTRTSDLIRGLARMQQIDKWVYTTDWEGNDAGQWYWGRAQWFLDRRPLTECEHHKLSPDRVCDINTQEDWDRAVELFRQFRGEQWNETQTDSGPETSATPTPTATK